MIDISDISPILFLWKKPANIMFRRLSFLIDRIFSTKEYRHSYRENWCRTLQRVKAVANVAMVWQRGMTRCAFTQYMRARISEWNWRHIRRRCFDDCYVR
jgi:hypothetical protein